MAALLWTWTALRNTRANLFWIFRTVKKNVQEREGEDVKTYLRLPNLVTEIVCQMYTVTKIWAVLIKQLDFTMRVIYSIIKWYWLTLWLGVCCSAVGETVGINAVSVSVPVGIRETSKLIFTFDKAGATCQYYFSGPPADSLTSNL